MLGLILLAASVSGAWSFDDAPTGRLPDGFEVVSVGTPAPEWVVKRDDDGGVLVQGRATTEDRKGRHSFALLEGRVRGDVVLRARVKLLTPDGQAGLVLRYQDPANHYVVGLDARRRKIRLVRVVDGNRVAIHGEDDVALETGVWYELKVRLRGPKIGARMYGLRLFHAKDRSLPESGRVGFFCDDHTVAHFDDLSLTPAEPD